MYHSEIEPTEFERAEDDLGKKLLVFPTGSKMFINVSLYLLHGHVLESSLRVDEETPGHTYDVVHFVQAFALFRRVPLSIEPVSKLGWSKESDATIFKGIYQRREFRVERFLGWRQLVLLEAVNIIGHADDQNCHPEILGVATCKLGYH